MKPISKIKNQSMLINSSISPTPQPTLSNREIIFF
jgi:hypothetical protein